MKYFKQALFFFSFFNVTNIVAQLDGDKELIATSNQEKTIQYFGDLDGDTNTDVISVIKSCDLDGDYSYQLAWQKNNGVGDFGLPIKIDESSYYDIALGDIDNDGDIDIVGSMFNGQIHVLKNDGQGVFDKSSLNFYCQNIQLNDINDDGLLDLTYQAGSYEKVYTVLNVGNGLFDSNETIIGTNDSQINFIFEDLNNDGYDELINAYEGSDRINFKIGKAGLNFENYETFYINYDLDIDFGDFNGDNYKDLVLSYDGKMIIYFNQYLSDPTNNIYFDSNNKYEMDTFYGSNEAVFNKFNSNFTEFAIKDIDKDGDDDMVVNINTEAKVFKNKEIVDNKPVFEIIPLETFYTIDSDFRWKTEIQDINNDGLYDAIIGTEIFVQDSDVNFVFHGYTDTKIDEKHIATDINNDGFKDIITFKEDGYEKFFELNYFINKGNNKFSERKTKRFSYLFDEYYIYEITDVFSKDVDGDNDEDILLVQKSSNGSSNVNNNLLLIENKGLNYFSPEVVLYANLPSYSAGYSPLNCLDFDEDGDTDLFAGYNFFEKEANTFKEPVKLDLGDDNTSHYLKIFEKRDANGNIRVLGHGRVRDYTGIYYRSVDWFTYDSNNNLVSTINAGKLYNSPLGFSTTSNISVTDIMLTDVEGDGYEDILMRVSTSVTHKICYFKKKSWGSSYDSVEILIDDYKLPFSLTDSYNFKDVDLDGDIDLFFTVNTRVNTNPADYHNVDGYLFTNNEGVFSNKIKYFDYSSNIDCFDSTNIAITVDDLDNNGSIDLINAYPTNFFVTSFENNSLSTNDYSDDSDLNFSLYPNPTKGNINLNLKSAIDKVTIYSLTGRKIIEFKTNSFDISFLNQGVYLVDIESEGNKILRKIIKN